MAAQKHWRMAALLIIWVVFIILWISSIVDDFKADEAQRAKHECKSNTTMCDLHAYCYGNDTSYVCICKFGWLGGGFVGDGHLGCQKRQHSKLRIIAYIIEIVLIALIVLWFLLDAISAYIKFRARTRNQSQIAPAEQAYPRHEVNRGRAEEV